MVHYTSGRTGIKLASVSGCTIDFDVPQLRSDQAAIHFDPINKCGLSSVPADVEAFEKVIVVDVCPCNVQSSGTIDSVGTQTILNPKIVQRNAPQRTLCGANGDYR